MQSRTFVIVIVLCATRVLRVLHYPLILQVIKLYMHAPVLKSAADSFKE